MSYDKTLNRLIEYICIGCSPSHWLSLYKQSVTCSVDALKTSEHPHLVTEFHLTKFVKLITKIPNLIRKLALHNHDKETCTYVLHEPRHEKTGFLPMRKQRCRSASQ